MKKLLCLAISVFCINAYADQDQAASLINDSDVPSSTQNKSTTSPRLIIVKPEPSHTTTTQAARPVKQNKTHGKNLAKKTKASKNKKGKQTTKSTKKNASVKNTTTHKTTKAKSNKKSKKKAQ